MALPSLQDNTADVDRLCRAVGRELNCADVEMDLGLAKQLPDLLRANGYAVRCVVVQDRDRGLVLDVLPIHGDVPAVGLAVDLGPPAWWCAWWI